MTDTTASGPMLAADGTPLRVSLRRALRRQKLRALALIAPLLIFILVSFVAPIGDMLLRSIKNDIVPDTLPRTVAALAEDDAGIPGEAVFAALHRDLSLAFERKVHTRLGTRLNYEWGGASSLFRGAGSAAADMGEDLIPAFEAADARLVDPARWAVWFAAEATGAREALPETALAWDDWLAVLAEEGEDPLEEDLPPFLFVTLAAELAAGATLPADMAPADAAALPGPLSLRDAFLDDDEEWGEPDIWRTIRAYSGRYTAGYFANAVDLGLSPDGVVARPEDEQVNLMLFQRTLFLSLTITVICILLAYPVAFLLASLPARSANLLMILVLLPFWTSLLVRTSAWKVLLQQQGVINDILVWTGLVADDNRLILINNTTGTIIAMTHILLPFMILPLYSVMKTIPPSYVRAARSLGANDWTAFWRVYFPQSVPGIGAGSILVFILAIGYYITPALVGGTTGVFISNRIAYHISDSLNWGLAAALGALLLVVVLGLYWVYDRLVGIDNVKLGG